MNAKDLATLVRLKSLIKDGRNVVLNRELGLLVFTTDDKEWGESLVFEIDLQPPWGYRVAVSLRDEIVVEGDAEVAKMIDYVAKKNAGLARLSRLNFDINVGTISSVCHIIYDEPPTDAALRQSLTEPAKLLSSALKDIRAIARDDSPSR